jgi:hypothetical protein
MGLPEYDAAEIKANASSDPSGTVEDIETMIETEQVTDSNRQDLLDALDDAESAANTNGDIKTEQHAALLSAQIEINGDEASKTLITNTSSVINELIGVEDTSSLNEEDIISSLTSGVSTMSDAQLQDMFVALSTASGDYSSFEGTDLTANDPGLSDGEKGDLLIMATMTIVVSDLYTNLANDTERAKFRDYIRGENNVSYNDLSFDVGYDPMSNFEDSSTLMNIVSYADTSGEIYSTFQDFSSK